MLAKLKELHELSKPLIQYMQENCTMDENLVINERGATVYSARFSVPAVWDIYKFEETALQDNC